MDDVLPSADVIQHIQQEFPLVALDANASGETAQRWGYANAAGVFDPSLGEVGVISSVTQAFCRDCNRARLSTEGKLYLCLFATQGYDLRSLLRDSHPTGAQATDADITSAIGHIWHKRDDRYSELRASMPTDSSPNGSSTARRVEMSYIGG
jgi:cyclic pyranopterin phosphate synthase